ncbi:MAG: SDR family NAD(P)-dependent oxidoreductase, partial [Ensifer adhaerens]
VKATLAPLGRIDVLVNNAGLERITPLLDEDDAVEDTFRRITDINTNGTFYVTHHAVPHMKDGGRIVVTASIWSRVAVPEFSAYIASKHANLGFTRVMAKELGPKGIRVNAVCPGWVRTEAAMLSLKNMSLRTGRSEEDLLAEIVGAQVLPGLLEPEDLAAPYLFLASDGAKDMTGQALMLDRGEVMA